MSTPSPQTDTKHPEFFALDKAKTLLRKYASQADKEPLRNSVFAMALDVFKHLETDNADLAPLWDLTASVKKSLISQRCDAFRAQHELDKAQPFYEEITAALSDVIKLGFDAFKAKIEQERGGIVFTAHPTFSHPITVREAMAQHIVEHTEDSHQALMAVVTDDSAAWSEAISLESEHKESQTAIINAQIAQKSYLENTLYTAKSAFPNQWRTLSPYAPTIATWVGYDLDGRSDIHWTQSMAFRLREKAAQLDHYRQRLDDIMAIYGPFDVLQQLSQKLSCAYKHTLAQKNAFEKDTRKAENLVHAANLLSEPHANRLTDSKTLITPISALISAASTSDNLAADLMVLRAQIIAGQLGTARIHLRLNAVQMTGAIKRDLGLSTDAPDLGRLAIKNLADKISSVSVQNINIADLHFEQSTARRQFMMCAQMLRHVDEGSPIRFLIAESENPATMMGALYLAKLYGVDKMLDISPLFETPDALSMGGRFIDRLLIEPTYLAYLRGRGYLSVQLGFSDAGRFVGQIAADMAIERLHNLIGKALAIHAPDLDLVIFNTHGESMGRGAFPGTFKERFAHLLTPWTLSQFDQYKINIRHEMSFQGGDGFMHFINPTLAKSTFMAVCAHFLAPIDNEAIHDAFYTETDFVWDFYRSLTAWQEALFQKSDYDHLLSDFAPGFLVRAGSRQTRRSAGARGPRSLRAISHNATLQQLGVPLNTCGGFGSALPQETDSLARLINRSARLRSLMKLAAASRMATSVPSLRAYATVYNPNLWTDFARMSEDETCQDYIAVQQSVATSHTHTAINRIADHLSIDLNNFDFLLKQIDDTPSVQQRHEWRIEMHILHAVRQAIMLKILTLSQRIPRFASGNDLTTDELRTMLLEMRIAEAVTALKQIFPATLPEVSTLQTLVERSDNSADHAGYGYDRIHEDLIYPLEELGQLIRTITLGIAHAYNAYG